jgi:hypothetical protein
MYWLVRQAQVVPVVRPAARRALATQARPERLAVRELDTPIPTNHRNRTNHPSNLTSHRNHTSHWSHVVPKIRSSRASRSIHSNRWSHWSRGGDLLQHPPQAGTTTKSRTTSTAFCAYTLTLLKKKIRASCPEDSSMSTSM